MFSILVIDDDPLVRRVVREMLEPEGFEILEASSGKEGLRTYRQQPTDLVLCDMFMPKKNGLETIRQFHDEFGGVKVIAMSGGNAYCGPMDFLPLSVKYGADATLRKPFEKKSLLEAVENALRALDARNLCRELECAVNQ